MLSADDRVGHAARILYSRPMENRIYPAPADPRRLALTTGMGQFKIGTPWQSPCLNEQPRLFPRLIAYIGATLNGATP